MVIADQVIVRLDFLSPNGWEPYFLMLVLIDFTLCAFVFLINWRIARRFGWRGLAALLSGLWPRLSGEQARAACRELVELSLNRSVHVTRVIGRLDVWLSESRERGAPWDGAAHPRCARPSTRRRREDRAEGPAQLK